MDLILWKIWTLRLPWVVTHFDRHFPAHQQCPCSICAEEICQSSLTRWIRECWSPSKGHRSLSPRFQKGTENFILDHCLHHWSLYFILYEEVQTLLWRGNDILVWFDNRLGDTTLCSSNSNSRWQGGKIQSSKAICVISIFSWWDDSPCPIHVL